MNRLGGQRFLRTMGLIAVCAVLAGCVGMPTAGPVVESHQRPSPDETLGISFDPRPPQPGDSPADIVAGFLEAMKAAPIKTTVARQFLSRDAQRSWSPEQEILTYADLGNPTGGHRVHVALAGVAVYDHRGAWRRDADRRRLEFGLVHEGEEWRIEEVPDALVVPKTWFDDWYQQVSTYYFDPTGEILVPEPVFVPRGDQEASALVSSLLSMPADLSPGVLHSYFPPGAAAGLSVPISSGGVAEVDLTGDPSLVDDEAAHRMLSQLAWTLRQLPRVRAIRLRIGDRTISVPGAGVETSLDVGSEFDPAGRHSTDDVFGLQDGRLVRGDISRLVPTPGPLGAEALGVRSASTNLAGTMAVAVTGDGRAVVRAPVAQPEGEVEPLVSGTDLQSPSWDHRDRMWVLDRNGGRARVLLVADAEATGAREIDVPGLSGRDVSHLLVSRDGTRLVAVRRRSEDEVVLARVQQERNGEVLGVGRVRSLSRGSDVPSRVRDLSWHSVSSVAVLRTLTKDFAQVRTISVDGAPDRLDTSTVTRLRGPVRSLVSSPLEGTAAYALVDRAVVDLARPDRNLPDLPQGLGALAYAG